MKLRIKGNSLRVRITRSEVDRLINDGRIEETTWLGRDDGSRISYVLEHEAGAKAVDLRFDPPVLAVVVPTPQVREWATGDEVGIYTSLDLGARGALDIVIEKDFACLHGTDEDNEDAFPNPNMAVRSS